LKSKKILLGEGIFESKIFVTGNTIVDAVYQNIEISKGKVDASKALGIDNGDYFLATIHRQENVDNERKFRGILKGLVMIQEKFGFPVVYPIHPRTRKQLKTFRIKANSIKVIEPLDYLSFLKLESKAKLILTDSGGVQEEACILGIPCVTLRYNTERPETLEVGSNVLAGTDPDVIVEKTDLMLNRKKTCWKNPFGDGKAGKRIILVLKEKIA